MADARPHHDHNHDHDHSHDHESAGHGHEHSHGHHHGGQSGRAFAIAFTINSLYALAQIFYGFKAHSLALIADSIHGFGDMVALAAAWTATWLSRRPPSVRYTYGLGSTSILTALGNTILLMLITGGIVWQSLQSLIAMPTTTQGGLVLLVALAGVIINGGSALLFIAGRKHDLNKRAAFQHLLADAGITVGVLIAGGLIMLTGWRWLDPAASLLIALTIIFGSWSLLKETLQLALQGVPATIDRKAVADWLASRPGVTNVHDLHIWALSTTVTALTAHLIRPAQTGADDAFLDQTMAELERRFGIHHATLQIEAGGAEHSCHTDCGLPH